MLSNSINNGDDALVDLLTIRDGWEKRVDKVRWNIHVHHKRKVINGDYLSPSRNYRCLLGLLVWYFACSLHGVLQLSEPRRTSRLRTNRVK